METKRKENRDITTDVDDINFNPVLFKLSLRDISNVTLILPLSGLFICFVSGYIFQNDEIHETHCRVYNVIPSISSITGISPQRYLWRIVIALHISPRLVISFVHKNYLKSHVLSKITDRNQLMRAERLAKIVHCLSLIEISALAGVTYVSNKENYPIHEKIFITFMVTSLTYMLISLRLIKVIQPNGPTNEKDQRSLFYKNLFFALSIASTIGLIVFFLKHRLLCHDLAFSWFAFCEYLIAFSNMGFHCTTTLIDFSPDLHLIVKDVHGHLSISNETENSTTATKTPTTGHNNDKVKKSN